MSYSADATHDADVLRPLVDRYLKVATDPIQDQRRRLWADHFSLHPTRPPVLATFGMWNYWCQTVFGDDTLQCRSPVLREQERNLRMSLFHASYADDTVFEPWLVVPAERGGHGWEDVWGVRIRTVQSAEPGGAFHFDPVIANLDDDAKLVAPVHIIDEAVTQSRVDEVRAAVDGLLPVAVDRAPRAINFMGDIITQLCRLRGLEQVMLDMYENPAWLHRVLAFMRDGILASHAAAEAGGDFTLLDHHNQAMPYCHDLEWPRPDGGPRRCRQLWGFCAAQEMTLVSPAMHDEFVLQYQLPIMRRFGLMHYGCCEDLTRKIDMLRQVPNLRSIAVTPVADVAACAEQIGTDYAISWRPNPTDMVCAGWDELRIRRLIGEGLAACRGGFPHIHLKDIETLQGDITRLGRWVTIVRETIDLAWRDT